MLHLSLKTIERLTRLINNLLNLSRIEAGKIPFVRERVNLADIAKEVAASMKIRAEERGLNLNCSLPGNGLQLYADRDKIIQLFTNLVSNALKFTQRGTIEISAVDHPQAVECRVTDTGCGISEKDLPRAFEKFQQFGPTINGNDKGTGLGLAICKAIVELHGGRISVSSRLNKGTVFTFTLPKLSSPTSAVSRRRGGA